MQRPLKECPRFDTTEIRNAKGEEVVNCHFCTFDSTREKRCRLKGDVVAIAKVRSTGAGGTADV